jgi:ribosomal protein S6
MTLILVPELAVTKRKEVLDKVEKILVATKGKVEKKDEWGKKNLAYPIKKMT